MQFQEHPHLLQKSGGHSMVMIDTMSDHHHNRHRHRCHHHHRRRVVTYLFWWLFFVEQVPHVKSKNKMFQKTSQPQNATTLTNITNISNTNNMTETTTKTEIETDDFRNSSLEEQSLSGERRRRWWQLGGSGGGSSDGGSDHALTLGNTQQISTVMVEFNETMETPGQYDMNNMVKTAKSSKPSNLTIGRTKQQRQRRQWWRWNTTKTFEDIEDQSVIPKNQTKEGGKNRRTKFQIPLKKKVKSLRATTATTTTTATNRHPICPNFNITNPSFVQQNESSLFSFRRKRQKKQQQQQLYHQRGRTGTRTTKKNMNVAYRMVILSHLAYWEYHKLQLPENRTGFYLQSFQTGTAIRISEEKQEGKLFLLLLILRRMIKIQNCNILVVWKKYQRRWQQLLISFSSWRRRKTMRTRMKFFLLNEEKFNQNMSNLGGKDRTTMYTPLDIQDDKVENTTKIDSTLSSSCEARYWQEQSVKDYVQIQYQFYDWYEPTKLGMYHDTDLLISTTNNGRTLILSFAGTASNADLVTNLQTFEPASHSGFLAPRSDRTRRKNDNSKTKSTHRGALHRGFLNAYSRVERGSVLRLCPNCTDETILQNLNQNFGHCSRDSFVATTKNEEDVSNEYQDDDVDALLSNSDLSSYSDDGEASDDNKVVGSNKARSSESDKMEETISNHEDISPKLDDTTTINTNDDKRKTKDASDGFQTQKRKDKNVMTVQPIRKRGGCRVRNKKLRSILQDLVVDALYDGRTVHITGHSLGAAIGTLLALDIVVNFPDTPISQLQLWTFGAPQFSDNEFLESAIETSPRLAHFLDANHGKFHRFVTLSDTCQEDIVSTVTQQALAPQERNIRGLAARRMGGVRGTVVHIVEPYYLVTPEQYRSSAATAAKEEQEQERSSVEDFSSSNSTTSTTSKSSSTRSALAAHSVKNYIRGVSLESSLYPLSTDFPETLREWMGEVEQDYVSTRA